MRLLIVVVLTLLSLLLTVGAGAYLYLAPEAEAPRVVAQQTLRRVETGELVGYSNALGVNVWRGIPFAAPPAGDLRWKAPRPAQAWEGQREALADGSRCAAKSMFSDGVVVGSEDCLYLNIYAPADAETAALPVMFWIHGGGNVMGSGMSGIYDGSRFAARHRVVVVSINYRLGILGWFRHPALRSETATAADNSGNFGTLDQIQALHWVKSNIATFGGDPGRVTIFGESAGGWNVMAMMASPLAAGLFHGAIVQSGGLDLATLPAAENYLDDIEPGHAISSREIVSKLLILEGTASNPAAARKAQDATGPDELAAWLREKSAADILQPFNPFGGKDSTGLPNLFADGHVLPAYTRSQDLFANPANYNVVPVILGTNKDEMKLFISFSPDLVETVSGIPVGIKDSARYESFNRYGTDRWKIKGVDSLATALRQAQGESVYAYRFDADDLRDLGVVDLQELWGAAHALEIPYVFGYFPNPSRAIYPGSNEEERHGLSESMMSYWAQFAYSGNPAQGRSGEQTAWTPWQNQGADSDRLMVFDHRSKGGMRMSSERISMQDLKQRLLADTSFADPQAHCTAYKTLFRGEDFVPAEYAVLEQRGCQ